MKVFVNGAPIDCSEARTVEGLLQRQRLVLASTLVELNGRALHRREWADRSLQDNDRLELLQVAAGG